MRNILVAADLTANSENAFIRAIQLSQLSGSKLHVLHRTSMHQFPGRKDETASFHAELRDRIGKFVQRHTNSAKMDYEVHLETRRMRVYEAINQYARSIRANLVIIGRSKRSDVIPRSLLLKTGRVVVNAHCPVLVVIRPVSRNYEHILLEIDLRAHAEKILTPVLDFGPDIQLTALHSHPANLAPSFIQRLRGKSRERKYKKFASRALNMLQKRGFPDDRISFEAVENGYLDNLLWRLRETKIDVVIMTDVRHKLFHPETGDRVRDALRASTCDILSI